MSPDSGVAASAVESLWPGPPADLSPTEATPVVPSASPKPANDAREASPDSESVPVPSRSPTSSACEPYFDFIEISLSKGRNAKAIYQDQVDDHGFTGRYQSVKRFVRQLRGRPGRQACAVIVTAPGEEVQVDYGAGPMVRDPHSGRYRRTRMFLGYSRKAVHLLTFRSNTRIWAELHEQAFRRLGGATRTVVLDNLGEGVLKPDIYDPALNPLYRDLLTHCGAVALPCRVRDPNRKGKVERSVGRAKNTPLKGLRFESLEDAQAYLDRWEQHWADTRIHGTTKRQVAAMFAEEKPALLPLPVEPFRHYEFGDRGVNLDGCVEVEAAYYPDLRTSSGFLARSNYIWFACNTVFRIRPETRLVKTSPAFLLARFLACCCFPMFLRSTQRKKNDRIHRYFSVVENRRLPGSRTVPRTVLYLGEINDQQQAAWRKTLEVFDEDENDFRTMSLFPDDREVPADVLDSIQVKLSGLELRRPRTFGACWLGCEFWQQLGLDEFWQQRLPEAREAVSWE
jgi:transposase